MPRDYTPRLSIALSADQYRELQRLIPWGLQRQLFSVVVDEMIELLKKDPERTIACLLTKHITLRETLPTLKKLENSNES